MATFKIKQGDTLAFFAKVKDSNGDAVIYSADRIKSEIVDNKGNIVGEFIITESDVEGQYLFVISDTSLLIANTIFYTDIQYTDGDITVSSNTMTILIEKDVTK